MIRAKDSILYGRHVFVSSEAKIYQKTDSNESPFIEIGKVAPSFAEGDNNIIITPSKEEWPNTGTLSIDN